MAAPEVIVPIFPLPDVTFFPHTLLPLHVFEARYRMLVIDALERDRRLAVVKLRPGYDAGYYNDTGHGGGLHSAGRGHRVGTDARMV